MAVYSEGDAQRIILLTSNDGGTTWVPATSFGGGGGGSTMLNGAGAPSSGTGATGDFYIDTANTVLYGPKNNSGWGSGVSLIGPQGATGSAGADGNDGATWYSDAGAPGSGIGSDGDYYLDTDTGDVYKKTSGSFSVVASIKGPQGDPGTGGTSNTFVLDSTATPGDNVFDNWDDLYTELSGIDGYKYVTVIGSQHITAGTYDLSYTVFYGPNIGGALSQIIIDDAVTITSWNAGGIDRGIQLVHEGTTPAMVFDDGGTYRLNVGDFCALLSATCEFVSVENGSTLEIYLGYLAGISNNASYEVVAVDNSNITVMCTNANLVSDDVFRGDVGTGQAFIYVTSPSSQLNPGRVDNNLTGTVSVFLFNAASFVAYDPSVSGIGVTNMQEAIDSFAWASGIQYDPTASGLASTNVQTALDEVAHASGIQYNNAASGLVATYVQSALDEQMASSTSTYDNTTSGLTATNVQAAIDELKSIIDAL